MIGVSSAQPVLPDLLSAFPIALLPDTLSWPLLMAAVEDPEHPVILFNSLLHVVHASPQIRTLLDVSEASSCGKWDLLALISQSSLDSPSMEAAKQAVLGFQTESLPSRPLLLRMRGTQSHLYMRLRNLIQGHVAAVFSLAKDDAGTVALFESVNRDALTKLANRPFFEQALASGLVAPEQGPLAVLLIDLDRFKAVNDTLGHGAGDALLRLVSERLQASVRETDVVARFGGDEFAVLVEPSPTIEQPIAIAERILDLVQRTYLIEGQLVNIGASIGIAMSPGHGSENSLILKNADLALYHSKENGRGKFSIFDVGMEKRALERRESELELRKALALRQLELFYQPQMDTAGRLVGFEALIRWRHPVRGVLPPADFLPIAEEIGVIVPIGEWVLRTACKQAMKWPKELTIAVNASPLQFDTGTFAESVKRALKSTGLPGERLEIEITEGILLRNSDAILATLHELRAMKVRIAMDDFGTGYASLSQLAKFPFDKIKIDKSLAGFEGEDIKQRAIVRAITALGQSLGVCTLAEGVETADQFARLQADGCSSVQGFFFGHPLPAGDLGPLISQFSSTIS